MERLERKVLLLEREVSLIKKMLEIELLGEVSEAELEKRMKNPEFISEEEFWREVGVED